MKRLIALLLTGLLISLPVESQVPQLRPPVPFPPAPCQLSLVEAHTPWAAHVSDTLQHATQLPAPTFPYQFPDCSAVDLLPPTRDGSGRFIVNGWTIGYSVFLPYPRQNKVTRYTFQQNPAMDAFYELQFTEDGVHWLLAVKIFSTRCHKFISIDASSYADCPHDARIVEVPLPLT